MLEEACSPDRYVLLLVCYLNKLQTARCNDKDDKVKNPRVLIVCSGTMIFSTAKSMTSELE